MAPLLEPLEPLDPREQIDSLLIVLSGYEQACESKLNLFSVAVPLPLEVTWDHDGMSAALFSVRESFASPPSGCELCLFFPLTFDIFPGF